MFLSLNETCFKLRQIYISYSVVTFYIPWAYLEKVSDIQCKRLTDRCFDNPTYEASNICISILFEISAL